MDFKKQLINLLENNCSNDEIDQLLKQYISIGGRRKDVYKILNEVFILEGRMVENNGEIQEQFDYLGELLTSIIGFCSASSIIRFKNEPSNDEDFISYVRGEKWK